MNFDDFYDIRKHKPRPGDVIACYTAVAEFVESREKGHVIDLLTNTDKMLPATQVMMKLHHAREKDAILVLKEMTKDLISGMSKEEVNKKPYKYVISVYFYTKKENIPTDDPHWSCISLLNLNRDFDKDINI